MQTFILSSHEQINTYFKKNVSWQKLLLRDTQQMKKKVFFMGRPWTGSAIVLQDSRFLAIIQGNYSVYFSYLQSLRTFSQSFYSDAGIVPRAGCSESHALHFDTCYCLSKYKEHWAVWNVHRVQRCVHSPRFKFLLENWLARLKSSWCFYSVTSNGCWDSKSKPGPLLYPQFILSSLDLLNSPVSNN